MMEITKIMWQGFEVKKFNNLFKYAKVYMIDENDKEYVVNGDELKDFAKEWDITGVVKTITGEILYVYSIGRVYKYIERVSVAESFEDNYVFKTTVSCGSTFDVVYLPEEYRFYGASCCIAETSILTFNDILDFVVENDYDVFALNKDIYIQEYCGTTYQIHYRKGLAGMYAKEAMLKRRK